MSKVLYTPTAEQKEDLASIDAAINQLFKEKAAYLQAMRAGLGLPKELKVTWNQECNLVEVPVVPMNPKK